MFMPPRARQLVRALAATECCVFTTCTDRCMCVVVRHLVAEVRVRDPTQIHFTSCAGPLLPYTSPPFQLGISSCHNLCAVDDDHIMTVSSDGTRVWRLTFSNAHESVLDVCCVAYLRQCLPVHGSRGDAGHPSYVNVVDVCANAVIMRSPRTAGDGLKCIMWIWRAGTVVELPNLTSEVYDLGHKNRLSHENCMRVANATHQMFFGHTSEPQFVIVSGGGAHEPLRVNVFNVGDLRTVQNKASFSLHFLDPASDDASPLDLRLTFGSSRSVYVVLNRYLISLYSHDGFALIDLRAEKAHAFHTWNRMLRRCLFTTCSKAYDDGPSCAIQLSFSDSTATAPIVEVVTFHTLFHHVLSHRLQPDYVLHVPRSSTHPSSVLRLAFMTTGTQMLSLIVDYDTEAQACTLIQVFKWANCAASSIVAVGVARHRCAVEDVFA